MLKLLLDENVPKVVAREVSRHRPGADVIAIQNFHGGTFLGVDDEKILEAARLEGRTLVSYDQSTILSLLLTWGFEEKPHAGMIVLNHHGFPTRDMGRIVRALQDIFEKFGNEDWTNRVYYPTPNVR